MSNYIDKIKKNDVEYDIHASNGGTKLYKHEISFDTDVEHNQTLSIISTMSEAFSLNNINNCILSTVQVIAFTITYDSEEVVTFALGDARVGGIVVLAMTVPSGNCIAVPVEAINSDTVTPL